MKKAAGLVFGKGNIGGTGGGEAPPLSPGVRGEVLLKPGNPKGWIMSSKGSLPSWGGISCLLVVDYELVRRVKSDQEKRD